MTQAVLVIAAHPDDEILGCGGVIARHIHKGDAVHVLVVTRGIPKLFPTEDIEHTRSELKKAHSSLRITSTHFLDLPAPQLDSLPNYEIADAIFKVIQDIRPSIVYVHHAGDIHNDHQAVFQATLVATRPINSYSVKLLLCYETLSETEWASPVGDKWFIPTMYVDITQYLSEKLAAMACYESQLKAFPHSRSLEAIEALARLRGATVGVEAAEAFSVIRHIIS